MHPPTLLVIVPLAAAAWLNCNGIPTPYKARRICASWGCRGRLMLRSGSPTRLIYGLWRSRFWGISARLGNFGFFEVVNWVVWLPSADCWDSSKVAGLINSYFSVGISYRIVVVDHRCSRFSCLQIKNNFSSKPESLVFLNQHSIYLNHRFFCNPLVECLLQSIKYKQQLLIIY